MNSMARKPERRKHPRDNEHHLVGALHRLQFLRALRGQGLLDALQPGGQRFGILRRGGFGLRAAALDGELGGVKLFLKLQVAAQRFLGIRFVGSPRAVPPGSRVRPRSTPADKETSAKRQQGAAAARPATRERSEIVRRAHFGWLSRRATAGGRDGALPDRGSTGC